MRCVAKSVGTINELTQSNADGALALAGVSRQVEGAAEMLKAKIGSFEVQEGESRMRPSA